MDKGETMREREGEERRDRRECREIWKGKEEGEEIKRKGRKRKEERTEVQKKRKGGEKARK